MLNRTILQSNFNHQVDRCRQTKPSGDRAAHRSVRGLPVRFCQIDFPLESKTSFAGGGHGHETKNQKGGGLCEIFTIFPALYTHLQYSVSGRQKGNREGGTVLTFPRNPWPLVQNAEISPPRPWIVNRRICPRKSIKCSRHKSPFYILISIFSVSASQLIGRPTLAFPFKNAPPVNGTPQRRRNHLPPPAHPRARPTGNTTAFPWRQEVPPRFSGRSGDHNNARNLPSILTPARP